MPGHTTPAAAEGKMVPQAETANERADSVLKAVRSGIDKRYSRQGALRYIVSLGQSRAQRVFLGDFKHKTINALTECMQLLQDSDGCMNGVLRALRVLELDEEDLGPILQKLESLSTAGGTTGSLAKSVVHLSRAPR